MSAKKKKRAPKYTAGGAQVEQPRALQIYFFEPWCFVRHPADRALWLRVPSIVGLSYCAACGAKLGEPCRGGLGVWTRSVHVDRKNILRHTQSARPRSSRQRRST